MPEKSATRLFKTNAAPTQPPRYIKLLPRLPYLQGENVFPMTRIERRLAERFHIKIPLRVRIAKSSAPEHVAEALNVSTRGVYFATDVPLSKGTPVHLVFEMPEEVTHKPASEWRCTGHVVHVQRSSSPQRVAYVGVGFDCYEVLLRVPPSVNQVSQLDGSRMTGSNGAPQRNR
jgi:PilZ domain-containing protein